MRWMLAATLLLATACGSPETVPSTSRPADPYPWELPPLRDLVNGGWFLDRGLICIDRAVWTWEFNAQVQEERLAQLLTSTL